MHAGWKRLRNGYPNLNRAAAVNASNDPSTMVLNKNTELWNKDLIFVMGGLRFLEREESSSSATASSGADSPLRTHTKDAFRTRLLRQLDGKVREKLDKVCASDSDGLRTDEDWLHA